MNGLKAKTDSMIPNDPIDMQIHLPAAGCKNIYKRQNQDNDFYPLICVLFELASSSTLVFLPTCIQTNPASLHRDWLVKIRLSVL